MTILAGWKYVLPSLTYVTPEARPSEPTLTSVTRASGTTVRFLVFSACGMKSTLVETLALV
jgi:hypothetical protein